MTSSQEAPALIQYACERCKTRFVLPPSSRKLSFAGKFHALSMATGRVFKFHEGLGAGYETSRRQLLAKMDDEAYQAFVQSFRFCHECRQFVCNECWSTSRRSCLTCVAKSMTGTVRPRPPFAPTGPEIPRPVVSSLNPPRKGRMRRDLLLVALALIIVAISLEAGVLLVNAMPGPVADATPTEQPSNSPSPSASPTAVPTEEPSEITAPTDTPTAVITATPSASPSPSATPSPTRAPTARPTAAPVPTPTPIPPLATPLISCPAPPSGFTVTCTLDNPPGTFLSTDVMNWMFDGTPEVGSSGDFPDANPGHSVLLQVTRAGVSTQSILKYPWGP
jgi:hypothetical protein